MFGTNKIQILCNIVAEGAIIFEEKAKNWSLQQAAQSQVVISENEPEIFEQQMRHFHIDKKSSFIRNLHSVSKVREQPRLRRHVRCENLRLSIGQPIYAQKYQ